MAQKSTTKNLKTKRLMSSSITVEVLRKRHVISTLPSEHYIR